MKNRFLYLFFISFLFAWPVQAKLFDLFEYTLPNGMRVIVIPNHKAPIVKQMVWYKVGSIDERPGRGGSAHLLEHLMFRGTSKIDGTSFNQITHRHGARVNAFTSRDFTAYHESVDISRLELVMFLEADRMQNLKISREDFERERDIVFQERKQIVDNNPFSPLAETMRRNLWQNHPYGLPVSGTEHEIVNLRIKDVRRLYDTYYVPNNAILIISGDIEPEIAHKLALRYYGKIAAKPIKERVFFPPIVPNTKTSISMKLPRTQVERLFRSYIAPSYNTDKEKIYAYAVLSQYLGEGETSELYKDLVVKNKLAVSASSSYSYAVRSFGSFDISLLPAKDVSIEKLREGLDKAIETAIKQIDDKKISIIKNKMLAGLIYLKDNPNDAAYIVGQLASVGMSIEEIENYADMIEKVSAKDVKEAALELFSVANMVEAVAEPLKGSK